MFYIQKELTAGVRLKIELTGDEVYTTCPGCGVAHQVDLSAAICDGELDLHGTVVFCSTCTAKRRIEHLYDATGMAYPQ